MGEIKSVRFNDDDLYDQINEYADRHERSFGWVVNKACEQFFSSDEFPVPKEAETGPSGVSTYMLMIDFELQDIIDKDTHANNIMAFVHNWLIAQKGTIASYPRLEHLGPMSLDERLGYVRHHGYQKIGKLDKIAITPPPEPEGVVIENGTYPPEGKAFPSPDDLQKAAEHALEPPHGMPLVRPTPRVQRDLEEPICPWTDKTAAEQQADEAANSWNDDGSIQDDVNQTI